MEEKIPEIPFAFDKIVGEYAKHMMGFLGGPEFITVVVDKMILFPRSQLPELDPVVATITSLATTMPRS